MKKLALVIVLATLPVVALPNVSALLSAINSCQHCIPVNEPVDDPCSIAGWCGTGNYRAKIYYYDRESGTWRYSPCQYVNGVIYCVY